VAGKVSGPGSGPPVGGPVDEAKSEGPSGVGGAKFADKLSAEKPSADKVGAADATKKAADPTGSTAVRGLTADVATELAAGRIDAKAALDRVIERVVDKQVGPGAPAAVREKVRAALESAVADDPLLGEKIRSLAAR
jgi:hypothetical protein